MLFYGGYVLAGELMEKVRPILIVSEDTVREYSVFLHHLLSGLADESIESILVCPPRCDVDSIVSPVVEVVRHPVLDMPLMARCNRRVLVERLKKFGPTVLHCLCPNQAGLVRGLAKRLELQ